MRSCCKVETVWKAVSMEFAVSWIRKLNWVRDQVSWFRHIKLRCRHVHHRPARKVEGRVPFALFFNQLCTQLSVKNSWSMKPILCQITEENLQSRIQCKMVSSFSPHLEQVATGDMLWCCSSDSVGIALWHASQISSLTFSGLFNLHIQDQDKLVGVYEEGFEFCSSQAYPLLVV